MGFPHSAVDYEIRTVEAVFLRLDKLGGYRAVSYYGFPHLQFCEIRGRDVTEREVERGERLRMGALGRG